MFKRLLAAIPLVLILSLGSNGLWAQDSRAILSAAAQAMGTENLKTIQYSGSGSNAGIGQNLNPNVAWPLVRVKTYSREIDFDAPASRVQMVRVQNGAEQTQNQNIFPNAPWANQFDLWLTPAGFLKGAMANESTVKAETIGGLKYNVVSFTMQGKYRVNGYINEQNMVERVQTWLDNNVLGDMLVESSYLDYKDFAGVRFPTMVIQKQGGFPTLILVVSDVKGNPPVNIQSPAQPAGNAAAPPAQAVTVQSEKVADGVFYLKGGTHHSVAVEFADHTVVIEAPQSEPRSLAVIAEVRKLIPNKPIRFLVNTHHHFDHSGGLRTYADEGATIVTHQINQAFYEKNFAAARTLNPDKLAVSMKKAVIEPVNDLLVLSNSKIINDNTRTVELHLIRGNTHNDGILMAYLPKEKILIQADMFTPAAPPPANAPPAAAPAAVNPNTVNLVENIERLGLDIQQILPLHGPGVATPADLYRAAGKTAPASAN